MRIHIYIISLILLLAVGVLGAQEPEVVFRSPADDAMWVGVKRIEVQVRHVSPGNIWGVEVYLDGSLLKILTAPPFKFSHDFGVRGENRWLRAVVKKDNRTVLVSGEIRSQQVDASHEVEVRQVVVPVVVKDHRGNYIRGLKQEDFILTADGEPQEISYFSRSGTSRFNMALAIDVSASMRYKLRDVLKAARDFLENLMTPNDKGALVFFNEDIMDPAGLTGDVAQLREGLMLNSPASGETAFFDAVAYSLELLGEKTGWKIVVIFSDGGDNSSYIDPMSLVEKVKHSNTLIYAIKNIPEDMGDTFHNGYLENICTLSGGKTFSMSDIKETRDVYQKIREDIKAQYVLNFSPTIRRTSAFHRLKVKVKNKKYKIRALKGFHY